MPKQKLLVESTETLSNLIKDLGERDDAISVAEVQILIAAITTFFKRHLIEAGYQGRNITALTTKFRDAGRRSAPWKPTSGRVPGRPQDGADGNRRPRWHFSPDHKFYADEKNATLVEVKYYLQTLAMQDAPPLPVDSFQTAFLWLLGHPVLPGEYKDPIQLIPINFIQFIQDPRSVQSGHLVPLDRGGRHIPENTFLMLARSNQLQGNLTVSELIELMAQIVDRHRETQNQE